MTRVTKVAFLLIREFLKYPFHFIGLRNQALCLALGGYKDRDVMDGSLEDLRVYGKRCIETNNWIFSAK